MKQPILRAATLTLALIGAMSAQAASVTYNFTAEVNHLIEYKDGFFTDVAYAELAGSHLAIGEKLVGSISYDAADAQFIMDNDPGNPGTNYSYALPTFKFEYTSASGGFSFSATNGYANTLNDVPNDGLVFEGARIVNQQGLELLGYSSLGFGDDNGAFLTSANLPSSINTLLPNLLAQSGLGGIFRTTDFASNINYGARLTSFSPAVAAVPEPGTYAMLLAGLGILGVAAHRQRRNNSV